MHSATLLVLTLTATAFAAPANPTNIPAAALNHPKIAPLAKPVTYNAFLSHDALAAQGCQLPQKKNATVAKPATSSLHRRDGGWWGCIRCGELVCDHEPGCQISCVLYGTVHTWWGGKDDATWACQNWIEDCGNCQASGDGSEPYWGLGPN
ncbi:hypothetical protein HDV00_006517 [Rhizophlyctis rosea]|nr:hypothetical protein HDV00_006517 [Rhizophlyctis rosea]